MTKKLVLQKRIKEYLNESNSSFEELAKKIEASPSSLFNWSEGGSITLNKKNLNSLERLAELVNFDLPFLLFAEDTAERYHFNKVFSPILQSLWLQLAEEIRSLVKKEMQKNK